MTYHDLIGTHYLQDYDTDHLFANMTGNTVLLGVAVARGDGPAGARSAVALGGFSLCGHRRAADRAGAQLAGGLGRRAGARVDRDPRPARRLGGRRRSVGSLAGAVWLAYGMGALGGALAEVRWHAGALAGPSAIICLIAVGALRAARRASRTSAG